MKYLYKIIFVFVSDARFKAIARLSVVVGMLVFSRAIFANDTTGDLLAGTTTQALATINGTGRYWAYIIDGAISTAAFAKTKNPFVFASVLAVALGITSIVKLASGGA